VISGHGGYYDPILALPGGKLKIKEGATVTLREGLGFTLDDGIGQLLDQGCKITALMKQNSKKKYPITYRHPDLLPNLILGSPINLNIGENKAGDAHIAMVDPKALGSKRQIAVATAASYTIRNVRFTNLFHIIYYALEYEFGTNFHWAACNQSITKQNLFAAFDTQLNMMGVAKTLFQMTANDQGYEAWKP
jgi:hypothetical protein